MLHSPTVNQLAIDSGTPSAVYAATAAGATVFVAKLNAAGSAPLYSTYLGGSSENAGRGIALDASGSAYVAGFTTSSDFPTVAPLQIMLRGGLNQEAFVTKLNSAGTALLYSTFLGGGENDQGNAIAVDAGGSAYVTGTTASANFPTANPIQAVPGGGNCSPGICSDGFLFQAQPRRIGISVLDLPRRKRQR